MLEDKYNTKIQSTAPYSPEMNPIERVHKTLMTRIKAIRHTQNLKWTECLAMALYGYNSTRHRIVGYTPYALVFAKCSDSGMDLENVKAIREHAMDAAWKTRKGVVDKCNSKRAAIDLQIGDKVYVVKTIPGRKLEDKLEDDMVTILKFFGKDSKKVLVKEKNGSKSIKSRKLLWRPF
eukprot:NODE_695_length_4670_cov_0.352439.p4 type:complete len:178 gc:universal NODE_695_length_4670_cov_0.352439:622-89(-)